MKPLTILTLVIFLAIAAILIYLREWYALAAFGAALLFFFLRRVRSDLIE